MVESSMLAEVVFAVPMRKRVQACQVIRIA